MTQGLTLTTLGELVGYSIQHLSELERGRSSVTRACVFALDAALGAEGALLELLPAAVCERAFAAQDRSAARAGTMEDVDPTNRRGLFGASAGAAAALGIGVAAPTQARQVDPELPEHWAALLRLLGRHDEMFGPHDVLDSVRRELGLISDHRRAVRGELRADLMRVEARWADLAAWLSEDTGDRRSRIAWTDRALQLATEADYPEMVAFARSRQSEWTKPLDARRAVAHAEAALRVPRTSAQTRAWCTRLAARGYALVGDAAACERSLADAYGLLGADSPAPPWAGGFRVAHVGTLAAEAECWGVLQPSKAIPLYERALRDWPRDEARDGGLHQARLALACAATGEHDRARAEGRKALAIARATQSATAARELKQLGAVLQAA